MYREMDKIKKICMNDEKELSRYKRQLYNIFTSRYLYEKSVGNLANLKQSCIDGMMKVEELRPCDRFLTTFVRE